MKLDKWQKDILEAKGHICLCTGRQVGKTTIFSRKAGEHMLTKPNTRIIVVSLTEDQAQLIIIMILNFLELKHKHMLKKPYSKNLTKNKIILTNGSQVISRPVGTTGNAVRGFTGDILILDEASRMPESVFTAAKPTLLTTGGKIWLCSTPYGKQGYFYESFVNKHDRFKVFHISSEKVMKERPISETWSETKRIEALKMLDEEKNDMGTLQYSQEYLGLFMEELRRFFTDKLIAKACTLKRGERTPDSMCFLGLDIARMGEDLGTYEIFEKIERNIIKQVENITTKKQLTTETFDRIINLHREWNFKEIGIDAGSGSLGVGLLDFLLKEPGMMNRIKTLNNRQIAMDKYGDKKRKLLKEDMYDMTRMLMERGVLQLLKDEDLIASLRNIQIEYIMKEGQETKIKIFGKDNHIVEGIVRAVWLANQKQLNMAISYM